MIDVSDSKQKQYPFNLAYQTRLSTPSIIGHIELRRTKRSKIQCSIQRTKLWDPITDRSVLCKFP